MALASASRIQNALATPAWLRRQAVTAKPSTIFTVPGRPPLYTSHHGRVRFTKALGVAFRSFQTRIVVSFLILITLVQIGTLIAVYSAIQRSARAHVKAELATAAKVVTRLLDTRNQRLVEAARILFSSDFAFKQAVALGDRNTLLSAMDNHRTRMGSDLMLVVSLDGSRVIDTLHRDGAGGARLVGVGRLVEAARQAGETADFMIVDDH